MKLEPEKKLSRTIKNILINKDTINLKQWHQSRITFICDLLDNDFSFLSHTTFQQNFQLKIPFTTYYGLINEIPPKSKLQKALLKTRTRRKYPLYTISSIPVLFTQQLWIITSNLRMLTSTVWFLQRRLKNCLQLSLCNNNRNKASNLSIQNYP